MERDTVALVCTRKDHVELQTRPLRAPGPREVRVRAVATAVSPGTERGLIAHEGYYIEETPFVPGYSIAGIVEQVGDEVTRFEVGDHVAGSGFGHQARGNAKESELVRIPDEVTFEHACFLVLGVIALQGVRKARIELGEYAMILGLGIIGQLALQLARLNGAIAVVGVDRAIERVTLAERSGNFRALDASAADWQQQLLDLTDGKGPQAVIETTGAGSAVPSALEAARKLGRVVILGSPRQLSTVNFFDEVHTKGVQIIGALSPAVNPFHESYPAHWTWKDDARCFVELLRQHRIDLDPLITARVHWTRIGDVYDQLLALDPTMVGAVIDWGDQELDR